MTLNQNTPTIQKSTPSRIAFQFFAPPILNRHGWRGASLEKAVGPALATMQVADPVGCRPNARRASAPFGNVPQTDRRLWDKQTEQEAGGESRADAGTPDKPVKRQEERF